MADLVLDQAAAERFVFDFVLAPALGMDDGFITEGLGDQDADYVRSAAMRDPNLRPSFAKAAIYRRQRARVAPRQEPTRTYFIQQGARGPIKIGCASNPRTRVAELQTGSPDRLTLLGSIEGGRAVESDLHRAFSDLAAQVVHWLSRHRRHA